MENEIKELVEILEELLEIYVFGYNMSKSIVGKDEEVEDLINRAETLIKKHGKGTSNEK